MSNRTQELTLLAHKLNDIDNLLICYIQIGIWPTGCWKGHFFPLLFLCCLETKRCLPDKISKDFSIAHSTTGRQECLSGPKGCLPLREGSHFT